MKRMLKYEMRRIAANKKYFILIFCLLLVSFLIIAILFAVMNESELPEGDRIVAINNYKSQLQFYENFITDSGMDYNSTQFDNIRQSVERLKFFINSGTTEYDYIDIRDYMSKFSEYGAFGFIFFFCEISFYPFLIIAVFGALWAFSFEQSQGMLKNLLQSTDRKTLFRSKLLASSVLVMCLPVLLFLLELIICALVPQRPFLLYNGDYKAMSGIVLLSQIGLRNLILIAFTYVATLLCTMFFKPLTSGLTVLLSYLFIAFIAMIAASKSNFIMLNIRGFELFNVFPVVGFLNYAGGFDVAFILMSLIHASLGLLFVWLSHVRFCKKDL